jgi:hypothetical protein
VKQVILKVGLACFAVLFAVVLVFCVVLAPSSDIVVRTDSPNGDFVALVEETKGGRANVLAYNVLVEPKSSSNSRVFLARFVEPHRNPNASGIDVIWSAPYTVSVQYLDATKVDIPVPSVHCGKALINVEGKSGVLNIAAPPGTMLKNVEIERKKEIFGDGRK